MTDDKKPKTIEFPPSGNEDLTVTVGGKEINIRVTGARGNAALLTVRRK